MPYVIAYRSIMRMTNYAQFRAALASMMDRVNEDRVPLLITRNGKRSAVLVDADEYTSMAETMHLLESPRNAERLRRAIAEVEAGGGQVRELDEPS